MHKIKLVHPAGVQFIEIENIYGESGDWRQIVPIEPSRAGRTLQAGHGRWEWRKIVKTVGTYQRSRTYTIHQFCMIDPGAGVVSLGLFPEKKLPVSQIHKAYIGELGIRHILDNGQVIPPVSHIAWTYIQQVNFVSAWVGFFAKVGGMVVVDGAEGAIGVIQNMDDNRRLAISLETGRVGLGLGGSVGIAVGVFTGFANQATIANHSETGWNFSLAIAENWGSWLKTVGSVERVEKAFDKARSLGCLVEQGKNAERSLANLMDNVATVGDLYKVANSGSGSFADDNPRMSFFDIPGTGKGLEISAFRTWTRVKGCRVI